MTSTEDRLNAFFTAIAPYMKAHGLSAAIISIVGEGSDCPGGFVCATRVGAVGKVMSTDMLQYCDKMHDDMHEVLAEFVEHLQGGKAKKPADVRLN